MRPRRSIDRWLIVAGLLAASGGWIAGAHGADRDPQQVVQGPNGQQIIVLPGPGGQRGPTGPTTGTSFLAGQVVEQPSGHGVPGAQVLVIRSGPQGAPGGPVKQIFADSQGRFFLSDLPAGAYRTTATARGYQVTPPIALTRNIELGDGERITDVKISLAKLASLAGTIRDDGGDPVVGTTVGLFRRSLVNGRVTLVRAPLGVVTDDRGAYRMANVTAGDYYVCACNRDPIPFDGVLLSTLAADPLQLLGVAARAVTAGADVATLDSTLRTFAPTFYPNSPTVAQAKRITLAPGEDKTGVDMDVVAVHATRVSGSVVGATGALTASSLWLTPAGESDEAKAIVTLTPMLVQPDGRFDFVGVPPGQYVLHVMHQVNDGRGAGPSGAALTFLGARGNTMGFFPSGSGPAPASFLWATQSVNVPDDGVTGLSVGLRPAMNMSGRLEFVGSAPPPAQTAGKPAVILEPLGSSAIARFGVLNPDATFRVPGLVPGRYDIISPGFPGWPTMRSVTVAGADVMDLAFELGAGDVSDVVLSFGETPMATLSGTVTSTQSHAPDTTVLIFPTDRRYWADPDASRRRYFSIAVSRSGSFTQAGLPAGEYFVVAVPDEAASEWQDATKLEAFSRTAQRITLADGDKKVVEVKR